MRRTRTFVPTAAHLSRLDHIPADPRLAPLASTSSAPTFRPRCTGVLSTRHGGPLSVRRLATRVWSALSVLLDYMAHGPSTLRFAGAGCQDLLSKAFMALIAPGDHVLCETPTYSGTLSILSLIKCEAHEVSVDNEGVNPDSLRAVLDNWPAGVPKPKVL